jgi:hypothetical protein
MRYRYRAPQHGKTGPMNRLPLTLSPETDDLRMGILVQHADILNALASVSMLQWATIAVAWLLIRWARHGGMWIYALVALPGTALHESSHFAVAWLLGGEPSLPSLIPTRMERGWRLGEVRFRAGPFRSIFIGTAPLLLAPLALWWIVTVLSEVRWPWYPMGAWVAAALLQASWPSPADWRLAAPAALALLGLAALLLLFR